MQPNQKAEKLIIERTSFVMSELDGEIYSHLKLVLKPTKCTRVFPTFLDLPMQLKIAQINAVHTEQFLLWRGRKIVTKSVKDELTSVFGISFTAQLHDNCTGCNNANIHKILDCLHENC